MVRVFTPATKKPLPAAAVNGAAAGAGANLALAADVVIATESASFLQAFTRIGLMPDAGGTFWLPRQIGFARAMGAMLFADKISARRAADWGMIWEAIPDDAFAAHWQARATALAKGPTLAFGGVKQALRASAANTLDAQLALTLPRGPLNRLVPSAFAERAQSQALPALEFSSAADDRSDAEATVRRVVQQLRAGVPPERIAIVQQRGTDTTWLRRACAAASLCPGWMLPVACSATTS